MPPAGSPPSNSPTAGGPVGRLELRPGVTLVWGGPAAPSGTSSTRTDPRRLGFSFQLGSATDDDRMCLLPPSAESTAQPAAPPPLYEVSILLTDPALAEIASDDATPAGRILRHALAVPTAGPVVLPLSPAARFAVESIRRCPFAGACRSVALAARGNDLLLEFLHALATPPAPRAAALLRTQEGRIRAAARLLDTQLEHPPTLAALAQRVGLSETTLKRGFHQLLDTTVFGYLRIRRMEHARDLLASGEATVLEAAARVGYSNPSNFAAAFRRQFGVNPKEFQLAARRQESARGRWN